MCGIAGFVTKPFSDVTHNHEAIALSMVNEIASRGPDGFGVWSDSKHVAIAHRRLAVLELSDAGHQPMVSSTGRFVITFNGEIYNHLALRRDLEEEKVNFLWRGSSDTETILACVEHWGLAHTLTKMVGMFAFALWDSNSVTLTLARDRFGEKPLYYGWLRNCFVFGSELKSLVAHPEWCGTVDKSALALYLTYGHVPTPYSIWVGIQKLEPGSYVSIVCGPNCQTVLPKTITYWSARDKKADNNKLTIPSNDIEAGRMLHQLLVSSVEGQMLSDVAVGAFLSGGIDSSTIVAIMQAHAPKPIQTFTVGFTDQEYNEAHFAKRIASHLGTEHTEMYVSLADVVELIPKLPVIFDEPFSDVSQIPTCLLAMVARRNVTVCLSGDGADELFGGYNRHVIGATFWEKIEYVPYRARRFLSAVIQNVSASAWDRIGGLLPQGMKVPLFGDKLYKLAALLSSRDAGDVYKGLVSNIRGPDVLLSNSSASFNDHSTWAELEAELLHCSNLSERMMFADTVGYLNDDILCKVDRATMASGLEVRAPFLNHHLAEFALNLPHQMKIRHGESKWLVRNVLRRYVPDHFFERPKQGFGVPIGAWLRGPLRDWADELLNPTELKADGLFDVEMVSIRWREHLSGRGNWQNWLWTLLMFQSWYRYWAKNSKK
jgi:asparagine synthase (glutamine-hydrolysing)